ncbi:hypothetical protein INT47_003348 [Mucor saturninus]|uniref:Uncharacterized protein n=1 Tax=Mucor saturninus TaxID=64648 RepID=A0A8H7RGV5_9FUNG|nr:hypothetical protein INT47_003348 [Mucor saturninus]
MAFAQQPQRRRQQHVVENENSLAVISDSDTDWHVLSSSTSSPILFPSESESSFRPSSDTDESDSADVAYLPSHDGTGTFLMDHEEESVHVVLPACLPTLAGIELSADDEESHHDAHDDMKFTTKRQQNLDSIPVHHPGIPGSSTSNAIISLVWANLKRLTNHLLENDTNTVDTLSNLMSEAVMEGCMPFSSHLHMDIEPSYHPRLGGPI